MLGFLKEFSPLNFLLSPVFSLLVAVLGAGIGISGFLERRLVLPYIGTANPLLAISAIFLVLAVIFFLAKKGNNWVGRISNAFLVAAIVDFAIFIASYFGFVVV